MNNKDWKKLLEYKLNEDAKDKLFIIQDTGMDGRELNGEVLWCGYAKDKEAARKKAKLGNWSYYVGEVTIGEMNKKRKKLEDGKNYLDKQIKILSKPIK
ncbi:MAG TPA: hypothetical protein VMX17_01515 [Candidatus Glassbacteria bacterium]|nr:hypothetical protein [Candidatus Glassbacteria bacterium]